LKKKYQKFKAAALSDPSRLKG